MTTQRIKSFIFAIRGQRIIIDRDLAQIYGVKTSRLNEQVKRNKKQGEIS
ncbi:MAG: ORF6N domain-containing protein [Thermodesulfobacteriota bacterium]|nr:ORF6N domain-containing protein [Thermodesulfobacteriota bacterium]